MPLQFGKVTQKRKNSRPRETHTTVWGNLPNMQSSTRQSVHNVFDQTRAHGRGDLPGQQRRPGGRQECGGRHSLCVGGWWADWVCAGRVQEVIGPPAVSVTTQDVFATIEAEVSLGIAIYLTPLNPLSVRLFVRLSVRPAGKITFWPEGP